MNRIAATLALLWTTPLLAETPMTGAEFEAYTTGKILYYGAEGVPYGAEEYHEGRTVRWSFLDGDCIEGQWYEDGPNICFVYEGDMEPQCWQFTLTADGLEAQFVNDPSDPPLVEVGETDDPLMCLAPNIGV